MTAPTTIDEYLDRLSEPARGRVAELRALGRRAAPEAAEAIKWGSPAFCHSSGTILFVIDAFKAHANIVFTPSTREAFDAELTGFGTGKGSVKLPYDDAVPSALLTRMIEYRIREFEVDGVKWM